MKISYWFFVITFVIILFFLLIPKDWSSSSPTKGDYRKNILEQTSVGNKICTVYTIGSDPTVHSTCQNKP